MSRNASQTNAASGLPTTWLRSENFWWELRRDSFLIRVALNLFAHRR